MMVRHTGQVRRHKLNAAAVEDAPVSGDSHQHRTTVVVDTPKIAGSGIQDSQCFPGG
jgi:hypothetical protein